MKEKLYIPSEDNDFFVLLRTGLWQKVDGVLSDTPDWERIWQTACQQTVQGIVADGIFLYAQAHTETIVPQELSDTLITMSTSIIKSNNAINELMARLCQTFEGQGITYMVMKGQAVARCYPNPLLRCPGDIDFFLDYENYERAKKCLEEMADRGDTESDVERHKEYFFGDIGVEVHADEAYYIGGQKRFVALMTEVLSQRQFRTFDCNGVRVKTAPESFDVLYSFLHSNKHYIREELGIRQLCDLAMLIHSAYKELDTGYVSKNVRRFKVPKYWEITMGFLQVFLGLPEDETQFGRLGADTRRSGMLWERCRYQGNFGRGDKRREKVAETSERFWKRNVYGFIRGHKAIISCYRYSPQIAIKKILEMYEMYIGFAYRKTFHIGGDRFRI